MTDPESATTTQQPRNTSLKVFCSPLRYVQGKGATRELGSQLQVAGPRGPAYLVASPRAAEAMADLWRQTFGEVGMDYIVGAFGGECSDEEIERQTSAARAAGAGVIIGVGGGKSLDTSRAVAGNLGLPAVNCPTVASSDAPCSALSVVYTQAGVFERIIYYPTIRTWCWSTPSSWPRPRAATSSPEWATPWQPGSRPAP